MYLLSFNSSKLPCEGIFVRNNSQTQIQIFPFRRQSCTLFKAAVVQAYKKWGWGRLDDNWPFWLRPKDFAKCALEQNAVLEFLSK